MLTALAPIPLTWMIMYPEDRVLVAYVKRPADYERVLLERWYHIPQRHAPKGLHAEYIAFYFGRRFGKRKYAVHAYARNLGHELGYRRDLFPAEPDHPRADDVYYRVQLGEPINLERPIISLQWRRITFLHTTWDRFRDAVEINDLFVDGGAYVNRLFSTLHDADPSSDADYAVKEQGVIYALIGDPKLDRSRGS
jgi:hypothetical protein